MNRKNYSLAYSPCPNDTFIFKGIAQHLIDLKGYVFDIELEDVETLNLKAEKGIYDISKLSFAAFGNLADRYALLRSGAALGMGCGPLIVSLAGRAIKDSTKPRVAVPGLGTTAYHLFRFYMSDLFAGLDFDILPMPFDRIMPAIQENKADFGVIIHEGRFVYQSMGLELKADLGQWWEEQTGLPIPLGCIAVKRGIDPCVACDIQNLVRASMDHAFSNPDSARDYIEFHARELDRDVIDRHIGLYVNDFSKDIGTTGEKAIAVFFEKACAAGLMKAVDLPLFAC